MLSHEWPRGIADFGDLVALLRVKPWLASDIADGSLGCPGAEYLLNLLQPSHWLAAHLHVAFDAAVPFADGSRCSFLALDKCSSRGREHMRVLSVGSSTGSGPACLYFDPLWLAILRAYQQKLPRQPAAAEIEPACQQAIQQDAAAIAASQQGDSLRIPDGQAACEAFLASLSIEAVRLFGK